MQAESNGGLSFVTSINSATNTHNFFLPSGTITTNNTYHFAVTLDGTNLKVYMNGNPNPVYSVACTINPSTLGTGTGNNNLNLLGHPIYADNNSANTFVGSMDEIRIWNVARTGMQIRANYQNSVSANSAGLVAYYKFDNAASFTGSTVTDATPNHNNATLSANYTNAACTPQPYVASNISPFNSYNYTWSSPGNANLGSSSTLTVSPSSTTTYSLNVSSNSTFCSTTLSRSVNVNQSVTISSQPSDNYICTGSTGSFSVGTANGGTVTYNWQYRLNASGTWTDAIGGVYSGNTTATLSITAPPLSQDGYQYRCQVFGCGHTVSPLTTNTVTLSTGSTAISLQPSDAAECTNGTATFSVSATGPGLSYAWQVSTDAGNSFNNISANAFYSGQNSATLTITNVGANFSGNQYKVLVSGTCGSAVSNAAGLTVSAGGSAAVSVVSASGTTLCSGATSTFTASPIFGGTAPTYQWMINGSPSGAVTASSTFTPASISNADVVSVFMTSNSACASPATATSAGITLTVLPAGTTASVTVTANPSTVCPSASVTFTAHPVNGGTTPSYTWKINGTPSGSGSTFSTASLTAGQVVTVEMSTSQLCTTPATVASSNGITVTATSAAAAVTLTATAACAAGTSVYTATPTNGGTTPAYVFKKNGSTMQSGTSASWTDLNAALGDVVTVTLQSSLSCSSPVTSAARTVTVITPGPDAAITPSGTTICSGSSVSLSVPAAGAGNMVNFASATNGANYITMPNNITSTMTAGFTWEGWVNPTTIGSGIPIFCLGSSVDSAGGNANDNVLIVQVETGSDLTVKINKRTAPTFTLNKTFVTGGAAIPAATSTHLAVTLNGTNLNLYTNGNLVYTTPCTLLPAALGVSTGSAKNNWNLIAHGLVTDAGNANSFKGSMDEVRVWNVARSADEIAAFYKISVGSNASGLLAYYKFDNASTFTGTAVTSATGSNNATLNANFTLNTAFPYSASTVSVLNAQTYSWTPSAGVTGANTNSISVTPATTTTYTVAVTGSTGCVTTNSQTIIVSGSGGVAPSVSISGSSVCAGTSAVYTAVPLNAGTGPTFVWTKNGTIQASTTATYIDAAPAIGDVIGLTMTGGAGACTIPVSASNYTVSGVFLRPSATITPSAGSIYYGDTATLAAPASGGGNMLTFASSVLNANYVQMPYNINATMTFGFTFEGWFKATGPMNTVHHLFNFGSGPNGQTSPHMNLKVETNGNLSFDGYNPTGNVTYSQGNFATAGTIVAGNTYHIAMTLDGATLRVYLNGTQIYSVASALRPANLGTDAVNNNNFLGRSFSTTDLNFKGGMDEVRIWNVARSAADIAANYALPVNPTSTGLLAYYKFDNALSSVSTTVTDATNNHNDATLSANFLSNNPAPYAASSATAFNVLTYAWSPSTGLSPNASSATVFANPAATTAYSVVVTTAAGCSAASSQTVTVLPRPTPTWTGATSTDWNTASNWQNLQVPGPSDSAIIAFPTARLCTLSTAATVNSVVVKPNAVLALAATATLNVKGNFLCNGAVNSATGSNMNFIGGAAQLISGTGTAAFYNLTVTNSSSGRVTNAAGSTVQVQNTLSLSNGGKYTNNGNTVLLSNSNGTARLGVLANVGDYSGNLTVQRYLPASLIAPGQIGANVMVGAPVTGRVIGDFQSPDNQFFGFPGANGQGALPNANSVWFYNPDSGAASAQGWVKPIGLSAPMNPGTGARVFFSGHFMNGSGTYSLTGPLPASLTYPITLKTCASCISSAFPNGDGWNMIANPVPSEISWTSNAWVGRSNVAATLYVWQQNNKRFSYYTYDPATGASSSDSLNGANRYIASGQGFFVKALVNNSVLTVTEACKKAHSGSYTGIQRAFAGYRLQLTAKSPAGYSNEALLAFRNDATLAYEPELDAVMLPGTAVNIATLTQAAEQLAINRMPIPTESTVIPVLFTSAETGRHTISFTGLEAMAADGYTVFLKDGYTGAIAEATNGQPYSFNVSSDAATQGSGRFSLVFTPANVEGLSTSANRSVFNVSPNPAAPDNINLTFRGFGSDNVTISITDALGREVAERSYTLSAGFAAEKLTADLKPGVYTIVCRSAGYKMVQKLVVN